MKEIKDNPVEKELESGQWDFEEDVEERGASSIKEESKKEEKQEAPRRNRRSQKRSSAKADRRLTSKKVRRGEDKSENRGKKVSAKKTGLFGKKVVEEEMLHHRVKIPPYETDFRRGLTSEQVRQRMDNGYQNNTEIHGTKSIKEIVRSNTLTYFNLIFVILAVCLIAVGSFKDLAFLLVVFANTGIGIFQELRSKKAIDNLSVLAEQRVLCVRDGQKMEIPSSQLVRDDIAIFKAGDQICADAVVCEGSITANESLLTGETDDIPKSVGAELRSGSSVTSGSCQARLTHVGAESYVNRLTLEAKSDVKLAKSEMMRSLDRLIRVIGILLIPVGLGLFYNEHWILKLSFSEGVRSTVGALIGMIPEGLYLLTSIALAAAVVRLATHKVLVRDMNCVETLARVDTLCVDKTGTITEPDMNVNELICLTSQYPEEKVREILSAFYNAMAADNDTARAMEREFRGTFQMAPSLIVPFTSKTKWSAVSFEGEGNYLVGAPEFIMQKRFPEIASQVIPKASDGYRVLLLASYQGSFGQERPVSLDSAKVLPIALVTLSNPVREEAEKTFQYFAKQGVEVKVISGDNPSTVSAVARRAGIEGSDQFVDASTLKNDQMIDEAVEKYTVFGRVTPAQKKKMVLALKKHKHTVAMTGDGVNDVLALKEADCGIAMASGSQAASQIAQLVLLNSDFKVMPGIVGEGRRVINNIQLSATLFLVKNIFSFLLALIALYKGFAYPLQSLQLTTISFLTIGCPAFFLAMQPNTDRIRGHFLANVFYRAFPGGITNVILLVLVELFVYAFDMGTRSLYSISCILVLINGLIILFVVCRPFNRFREILWVAMTVFSAIILFAFSHLLGISHLGLQGGLILTVHVMLCVPVMYAMYWIEDKINLGIRYGIRHMKKTNLSSF